MTKIIYTDLELIAKFLYEKDSEGNLVNTPNASEIRTSLFGTIGRVGIWAEEYPLNSDWTVYKMFYSYLRESAHWYSYRYFDGNRSQSAANLGVLLGMCRGSD